MRRRAMWFARALVLLFLNCAMALAQETPVTAMPAASGPEIIPTTEIPARADTDARFAQETMQRSPGENVLVPLEQRLDDLAKSVREQRQQFKTDELRLMPVIRLESLVRHWRFFTRQLDSWRASLTETRERYLDDAANLEHRKADWKATLAAIETESVPAALLERINSVQSQLTQAEQTVYAPLDKLLQMGERANAVAANIDAGQRMVTAAIDYNDRRLTRIDSPPLWKISAREARNDAESVKTGLQVEAEFLKSYNQSNRLLRRAYHILELALLPLLFWLSRHVRKGIADDAEMQASLRVLQRPFSSWLLMVMTGVLLVQPDAPIILHQLVLLIVLVPVLRLLPLHVFKVLGPWPYIASILYLLSLLSFVFLANTVYLRFYLLFLTLFAMTLIMWRLLRSRQRSTAHEGPVSTLAPAVNAVRKAGWAAIVLLCVSALANIFGNVSLADMLTNALLFSAYVGLVLYAGAHVLTSVMHLLLARSALARLHIVSEHHAAIMRAITRLSYLTALGGWLVIALDQFRIYRPIYEVSSTILTYSVSLGKISLTLGGALLFVFSVLLAFWVSKSVRFILRDEVLPSMSLPRGVANSVSSLTYYFLVITGLFVAMVAAGLDFSQLAFVIGALGVGIGLGLQGVVNNFVSGLILMFERPIQPGDVVEITGTSGKVREIGMRSTTITTFDGADVVVPNGTLLSEKLINWTLTDMNRRFDVAFGVAYGSDPKQVLELVMSVTNSTPGIAQHPEPNVIFSGIGTSSLDFAVRAWTDSADWVKVRSDLTVRIHDAIVAAGIEMPFPQRDLHLRSISPDVNAALSRLAEPGTART